MFLRIRLVFLLHTKGSARLVFHCCGGIAFAGAQEETEEAGRMFFGVGEDLHTHVVRIAILSIYHRCRFPCFECCLRVVLTFALVPLSPDYHPDVAPLVSGSICHTDQC